MFGGAVIGALVGFLLGAALVFQPGADEAEMTRPFLLLFTAGPLTFFGGVLGAAAGTRRGDAMRRVGLGVLFGLGIVVVLFLMV